MPPTSTILIIGTSFHTLRDYLREHGFDYIVLQDSHSVKHPDTKPDNYIVCDFSSKDNMLAAVDEAAQKYKIDGVITTYERYVLPAAEIAARLGVPGMPIEAARACTDKFIMRQKFAAAPEKISPDFSAVTSEDEVRTFAANHTFPLILKPANLSKSLLVFKNHDLEELIRNYKRMMETADAVYAKYAPHTTPKILIEEFMEGPVHSVDAFVDSSGTPHVLDQVVDYQTGYEIGYDDNFHYSRLIPSKLPPEDIEAIRHIAALGCKALDMQSSPAHIEIIRTHDGPRIVEIGARNGGYRERMHGIANGIDITGNAIAVALGKQPDLTPRRNDYLGVFELFPKAPGIFEGIANEEELQKLPSFNYYSVKAEAGSFVSKSSDGFKMCAVVILHNADRAQFEQDVAFLNAHISAQTTPAPS